jgi:predicted AAA+ superfamily ATPase
MNFEDLAFQNPHWTGEKYNVSGFKRYLYATMSKNLEHRLIISITGLRRVGKTVLMRQLINGLIDSGVNPKEILYFSFDVRGAEIREIITEWASRFSLDYRNKKLYVFFDEIQKIDTWGDKLKLMYDNTGIKFIISGSASMLVKKGKESLAGRILEYKLDPLSLEEYGKLKGIDIQNIEWQVYQEYLHKQFPELVLSDIEPKEYVSSIVNKVISEDFPKLYEAVSKEDSERLFRVVVKQPGQIIDYTDLAKDFGIDRETVSKYMNALVESYLVRKTYNYLKNNRKSEKSSKKYYPYTANLIDYILPVPVDFSLIAETDVAFQLGAEYFSNQQGTEIDFIAGNNLDIGVEVKMRRTIDFQDVKTLVRTKIPLQTKYVVGYPDSKLDIPSEIKFISLEKTGDILDNKNKS